MEEAVIVEKKVKKPMFAVVKLFYISTDLGPKPLGIERVEKVFRSPAKAKKYLTELDLQLFADVIPSGYVVNDSVLSLTSLTEKKFMNKMKKVGNEDLESSFNDLMGDSELSELKKYRKLFDKLVLYKVIEIPVG